MNLVEFLSPQKLIFILKAIIGLGFLIGLHEFGHFLFCKLFKVKTPTFSIGFGPRLITKKIGDTEFSLSAIPVGGYVEIAGMAEVGQGEQKEAQRTDKYSFTSKPYYQKMLIMSGGILFNVLFTYLAFILLFATGFPKNDMIPISAKPVIEEVVAGSPAQKAGLQSGDRILKFNNVDIEDNTITLMNEIRNHPDKTANLLIKRNNQQETVGIHIGHKDIQGKKFGTIEASFEMDAMKPLPLLSSIKRGISLTNRLIYGIVLAFKNLFVTRDTSQMAGPISIISEMSKAASKGFGIFLILLAIISINLAILNLIPLPIFDGGQMLFYTIEAIIGRSLPIKVREGIHIVSWILIMLLILYLSGKDILRIFWPKK